MRAAIYLVGKHRAYRGHAPGTTFMAVIDEPTEKRAVLRGDIRVIERVIPALVPGSYELPRDWPTPT